MGDAPLREWTGTVIREGNTAEWAAGWIVKGALELILSAVVGFFLTEFGYRVLSFDTFSELIGINTTGGVFAVLTALIYYNLLFCEYHIEPEE